MTGSPKKKRPTTQRQTATNAAAARSFPSSPRIPRFSDITNPRLPAIHSRHNRSVSSGKRGVVHHEEMRISQSYQGPVPPASELVKYNQAVPDAANRILIMAEEQSHHRQRLEFMALESDIHRSKTGLVCGFIIALAFLSGSVWLGLTGHDALGGVLGGSTLVALVVAFLTGTVSRKNERITKERTASSMASGNNE